MHHLCLELDVLVVLYDLRRVTNDGAKKLFFRDLLNVGETEFREKLLDTRKLNMHA